MSRLRLCNFGVSIDGFSAGTDQDLQNPLGVRGPEIMEWFFHTRTFRSMHGLEGGETGIDDGLAKDGLTGFGAWILGRNMFGPIRGPWPDDSWKGWWGDEPPYHVPAFVLTHHARAPITMVGGTPRRNAAARSLARSKSAESAGWVSFSPTMKSPSTVHAGVQMLERVRNLNNVTRVIGIKSGTLVVSCQAGVSSRSPASHIRDVRTVFVRS